MCNYILVIAYDFPPIGGSGIQRTLKFVKYLPSFGWQPIVLTVKNDENVLNVRDHSLLEELSPETEIVRTNLIEPYDNIFHKVIMGTRSKFSHEINSHQDQKIKTKTRSKIGEFLHGLLIPDRYIGWFPYAIRAGAVIIRKYRPRAIFSSSPAETTHLIGLYLASKFNIPWITDFRDPWTLYPFSLNRLYPLGRFEKYLEKKVLKRASYVITTTEECKNGFLSLYPSLDREKFHVIPNGYDEDDFKEVKPQKFNKLTMIFTGNLYQQKPPTELFQAICLAVKEKPEIQEKFQFLFIGSQYQGFSKLVKKWRLEGIVRIISYKEHHECLSYLLGSDICYYDFPYDKGYRIKPLQISAKIYEYLRSGVFIFAVIPENLPAAKIITETNSGIVIAPRNIEKMRKELLSLLEIYLKENKIRKRTTSVIDIKKFDRKNHTQKLTTLIEQFKVRPITT